MLSPRRPQQNDGTTLIERLREIVPFDNYCISGLDIEGCRVGSGVYLSSDLPEPLLREYRDEHYIQRDPLARMVSPATPIGSWHQLSGADLCDKDAIMVEAAVRKHGVAPRTVVSLWSGKDLYGTLLVTRTKAFTDEEMAILQFFAQPIHSEVSAPVIAAANQRLGLTQGEIRCLASASEGKSSQEIAGDTGYTTETVNFYLKLATKKLGASNRTQAVVTAIRRNLI
ncbi:LuxR C-terminal-related transcriptional regulator (plasmid) [Rhizobium sp. CB3171]|uniref:helix-turn-helix transcriptional regulator n=1 Tax=Rhizobium sp. CB3171 TaxID=3039157 RepID=UPI0024B0A731|nr:LuxR family transcriptional regulator [Rhizobium sp. CB3171]WFU07557.1 LuxR C-terminal-related transcriptional regulator [Rhizobium sp. CB3171]